MAREIYACDFEATTKAEDCRVWGWQYMNVFDLTDTKQGTDIDSFMDWLLKQNADCYFHNMRYDGTFILYWLFTNGYTYDDSPKQPKAKTFNTIISESGQWYQIDITTKYTGKAKPKRHHVTILDSLKKLPFPIKRIAQAFKLPILKGEIDYHTERPIGNQLTAEEKLYMNNDVEILARALAIQFEQGLTAMTIGSDSLKDFKNRIGKDQFNKFFPILDTKLDTFLRASYKGGFTWVKPEQQGKIIDGGVVLDVNSLYPWVMYEKLLPFGEPMRFKGKYKPDKNYPLYIVKFKCEFELKKGRIPTIQIKGGRFGENEYLSNSDGEEQILTMTSVDLNLFLQQYDIVGEITWIEGYKFRAYDGFFKEYIDYWADIKKKSKGAMRELAKLMLNSLYGKFGKNPDVTPKIPMLKDGVVKLDVPRDDDGNRLPEFSEPVYIPMGSFITAYAREKTILSAQQEYHRLIYCDTDSLHLIGKDIPENIPVDDKELGYWKLEYVFTKGKYLRQKTYVDQYPITWVSEKGKYKIKRIHTDIKCAGMPDKIKKTLTFERFAIGFSSPTGRLKPKNVKGGQVLIDGPYTLK